MMIAAPKPASARQRVAPSGGKMLPLSTSETHCMTMAETGGNTYALTSPVRATSSHASSNVPNGSACCRIFPPVSVREGMPSQKPAWPSNVSAVDKNPDSGQIEDDSEHRVVSTTPAIGEDKVSETMFGGNEFRTHHDNECDRDCCTDAGCNLRQSRRQHHAPQQTMFGRSTRTRRP